MQTPAIAHMDQAENFRQWLTHMNWDIRGGIAKAANALGVSRKTIERYRDGHSSVDLTTSLAMTAIANALEPWPSQRAPVHSEQLKEKLSDLESTLAVVSSELITLKNKIEGQ